MEKPQSPEEYKGWLKTEFDITIDETTKSRFELVQYKIEDSFKSSELWTTFVNNLRRYNDDYYLDTKGYYLFGTQGYVLNLERKSYKSFFLKTFRKNCLQNVNWPNEPPKGWVLPENWFGSINDIIRTSIVVKYLDGVKYLSDRLSEECCRFDTEITKNLEAKDEGYYAAHCYIKNNIKIPDSNFKRFVDQDVFFEVQITTQLQEVMRALLHKYYEENRLRSSEEMYQVKDAWKWDYKCDEFATNYLGHILHYVEGMIMDIRDRQGGGEQK